LYRISEAILRNTKTDGICSMSISGTKK